MEMYQNTLTHSHQDGRWPDDLDRLGKRGRHSGELVPDLLRGHVLEERADGCIFFCGIVQI